ncbi:hypothetical protein ACFY4C_11860 [Actinomadura viridis]|uniref:hypothetical protein n=1 Tax=Actinomadura viridis TaxID=58110 RepID=UPI00367C3B08
MIDDKAGIALANRGTRHSREVFMLALAAAAVFGLALLFDLADVASDPFDYQTLVTVGLLLIALHLAGVGAGTDWRSRGWSRRRAGRR